MWFNFLPLAGLVAAVTISLSGSGTETTTSIPAQATVPDDVTWGVSQTPNVYNDLAIDANVAAMGYKLVNITKESCGATGFLELQEATDIYGYDFEYLVFSVEYQSDNRLAVHIEPANTSDVFILSPSLVNKPVLVNDTCGNFESSDLLFRHSAVNESFWFEIIRLSTVDTLFSTKENPLVFSNQFIQFNTTLPEGHVITGLGEAIHGFTNPPGTVRTLFANDVGDPIDGNIYGVHPFYVDHRYANMSETNDHTEYLNMSSYVGINSTYHRIKRDETKKSYAHGVWWRTAAPQEVVIEDRSLTWRALNGVIDLYFFQGPSPKDVIQQYVQEIGLPHFQPYWALGYHQCRWGYHDLEDISAVVDNFRTSGLQLETIWSDIDYMDSYKDFTSDPHRYPQAEFKNFLDGLHENNQHYVPIVDAAIYYPNPTNATDNNYLTFHEGMDQDVFLKNPDGTTYIGAVWPGYTVFPDFLAENISQYWSDQFSKWHKDVPFDGIWLDMNEVSSFCVGSCGSGQIESNPVHPPFSVGGEATNFPEGFAESNSSFYASFVSSLSAKATATVVSNTSSSSTSAEYVNTLAPGKGNINYPPYVLNHAQGNHDLATHAVSPNATHGDGSVEYDVHNLYGYLQTNATFHAILDTIPDKRPFIISRSTFSGSGSKAGHWGGDNESKFAYAYFLIAQALTLGLSGIPFFGADVCGFNGNSDMELCSRWMQLGSFFPFYRNHNVLGAMSQEPYVWEEVLEASKITMNIRYLLLPYYYTLMYTAHSSGLPIMRALLWEFPDDPKLSDVDTQFFVGEAIIVTPVLEPGVETVNGTFPGAGTTDVYYDWYTHQKQNFTDGKNETLDAPLGHIPVHVRGGHILPMQEPGYTVAESRNGSWSLLVALNMDGKAEGKLYSDDGESYPVSESLFANFVASNGTLISSSYGTYELTQSLANVTILGVSKEPTEVMFNDSAATFTYANSTIYITELEQFTNDGIFASDIFLTWE